MSDGGALRRRRLLLSRIERSGLPGDDAHAGDPLRHQLVITQLRARVAHPRGGGASVPLVVTGSGTSASTSCFGCRSSHIRQIRSANSPTRRSPSSTELTGWYALTNGFHTSKTNWFADLRSTWWLIFSDGRYSLRLFIRFSQRLDLPPHEIRVAPDLQSRDLSASAKPSSSSARTRQPVRRHLSGNAFGARRCRRSVQVTEASLQPTQ